MYLTVEECCEANEDSEDDWGVFDNGIFRTSRHHFNYSTFLLIILSYLSIWLRDRADICVEDKKGHKNSTHEKYLHSNHG